MACARAVRVVATAEAWLDAHAPGRGPHARPDRDPLRAGRRARAALREAAAGVLFLRNKLDAEQTERRVRMARACHALLRAARQGDDATALPLVAYRRVLRRRIEAAEAELAGLRTQAADASRHLVRLSREIHRLERLRARRRAAAGIGRMSDQG